MIQTSRSTDEPPRLRRILAIDDSMSIRTFIARTLGKNPEEVEIVTAKDGGEGVQMAGEIHPDLILLDFILPDMKGDAVCQRLMENPVTSTIPVVLMSS
ncbi:MAG TPA: response regulator, partial [Chthoniobacteraceae bacterium]